MKTQINKLILLIITIFAISCSNDENSESPPTHEVKENRLLKEINEKTTKTFTYDDKKQITKIIEIGDLGFGTTQSVTTFTYGNGSVVGMKIDYTGSSSYGFEYLYGFEDETHTTLLNTSVSRYTGTSAYSSFSSTRFSRPTPNVIEALEKRPDSNDKTLYVYDLANGNITGSSVYTGINFSNPNGQLNNTSVYSNYDTKKSPYTSLPMIYNYPSFLTSVNNIGKSESSGNTVTYTYEYNEDGYPVKKTEKSSNGITRVTTFEYERI
ncbi:MAG: hypothetical protein ABI576_07365 [Flavobacterium sp.]